MGSIIKNLNHEFENRVRVGIMSALSISDWIDFSTLKQLLEVTDGNLASHLKALEKCQYIEYKKEFVLRKPKTSYRVTKKGKDDFIKHKEALERLLKDKPLK